MRRTLAILLLPVFGFSLILPVLSADTESKLPSCCRRDGKHHCSMANPSKDDSRVPRVTLKNVSSKCPLYPAANAMPRAGKADAACPGSVLPLPAPSRPMAAAQTEAIFHLSYSRARQKRGPPFFTA